MNTINNYSRKSPDLTHFQLVTLFMLAISIVASLPAQAQDGRQVNAEVHEIIARARAGISGDNTSQARAALSEMNSKYLRGELNSYESYLFWDMDAQLNMKQKDYASAAKSYENILPFAPDNTARNKIHSNLGNLYYQTENYRKAIDNYLVLYRNDRSDVQLARQIAYAYQSMDNRIQAITYAREVLDNSDNPNRNDYLFLKTMYLEQKDYRSARQLNDEMITLFNHPDDIEEKTYLREMLE